MTTLAPYLLLPGTAREALTFYAEVFGGTTQVFTFDEFSRTDGPGDAVAHGVLSGGPVPLSAADAGEQDAPFRGADGLMFSLLGAAEPAELHRWFDRLAEGGTVVDALQEREWGASDGRVIDRFGMHWLIGYEPAGE